MSDVTQGFPENCVGNFHSPQRAVVIWKVWLLSGHADATFLDGNYAHKYKKPINVGNDGN